MNRLLKMGVALLTKVIAWLLLGLTVRDREQLPAQGPAILVANHNSHLDALALIALYPLAMAPQLRPVANEHYFLGQNRYLAWFARHVLDIIPVACQPTPKDSDRPYRTFLQQCDAALARRQILILFPEGSRGRAGQLSPFHSGVAHLAKRHPTVPIVPIWLQGFGKAMPKGDFLLVPFVCSVAIRPAMTWNGNKQAFIRELRSRLLTVAPASHCSSPLGELTTLVFPNQLEQADEPRSPR
ncbi:MAG: lysophospholipid acyltransferase family protein [Cyanobacteria bacterium P01_D01_bin.71]